MRWRDLLFAHWRVSLAELRPLVPSPLEIDTFEGAAYVGIVPFGMEDVAPRGIPAIPRLSAFPEVNVRTYVRYGASDGIWFMSLDAASRIVVEGARTSFHLPYYRAAMSMQRDGDGVRYRSRRRDTRGRPASLDVRYRPTGPARRAEPGSLDAWLTDRLRLFAIDSRQRVTTTRIAHAAWPLRPAEAAFDIETLSEAQGLRLSGEPVHLAVADRLDVRAWWPRVVERPG